MNPASALDMFRIIVANIKARGNDILTIGGSLLAVQHMITSGWLVTYSPYVVDSRPSRVALLILIAAIGFGIGFYISPQAKELRRLCMLSLVTIAIGTAVADQGTYGWLATLVACIMLFSIGVGAGLNSIRRAFFETSTHGSSDWATAQHLVDNRVIRQDGIRLGYVEIRGQMRVIRYDGERHLVTTAPTRGGKGVNFIIPNLIALTDRSCVVVDPKGENAIITAAHRARCGQEVFVVDPWGIAAASGFKPARFNPIDWLKGSGIEPPRVCRRLFRLSHAASFCSLSMA